MFTYYPSEAYLTSLGRGTSAHILVLAAPGGGFLFRMDNCHPEMPEVYQNASGSPFDTQEEALLWALQYPTYPDVAEYSSPLTQADKDFMEVVSANTSNAYMFDDYTESEWKKCIGYLRGQGFNQDQIEEILRSKIMRWASGHARGPHYNNDFVAFHEHWNSPKNRYREPGYLRNLLGGKF